VQISSNSEYYSTVNFLSCIDLEHQLKEAHVEISSLQYINKLLYEELNNGASMNTAREWTRTASRSRIPTPNCNHNYIDAPVALQPSQPIYTTNNFSILEKLHDPAAENEATPPESKGTVDGLNHYHTCKRKPHQNKKSVSNRANNGHGRTSSQQRTDCQIPRREPMDQDNLEKEPNLTSRKHPVVQQKRVTKQPNKRRNKIVIIGDSHSGGCDNEV
jgi:hypothetical protein